MDAILKNMGLRELRLLMLGAGAILTSLCIVAAMIPAVKSYRQASSEVQLLERAALDSAALDQQLDERRKTIDELRRRLHGDMGDLPSQQVESYIIGRLQRVSWNNGVELVSVEPQNGDRVHIFQEMLFNVVLIGEYSNLYRWLWETRNELGFVVIKEYSLKRNDDRDEEPRLLARVSLASYRVAQ